MEKIFAEFAKLPEMDKLAFLKLVAGDLEKQDQYHIIDQAFGVTDQIAESDKVVYMMQQEIDKLNRMIDGGK